MVKLNANNPQTAALICIFLNPLCILNTQGMCALYSVTGNVGTTITVEIFARELYLLWAGFNIVELIFDMIFIL